MKPVPKTPCHLTLLQNHLAVGSYQGAFRELAATMAATQTPQLIITPELFIGGYLAQDHWLNPAHQQATDAVIEDIIALSLSSPHTCVVGHTIQDHGVRFNASSVIHNGHILAQHRKQRLPEYQCFQEHRYFEAGTSPTVWTHGSWRLGLSICEDVWHEATVQAYLPLELDALIVQQASPYTYHKPHLRRSILLRASKQLQCPVIAVNTFGGQDHWLFDGSSSITLPDQAPYQAPMTASGPLYATLTDQQAVESDDLSQQLPDPEEQLFSMLCQGIRDYVHRSKHTHVLLGLSGGIDSAVVAALCAHALGPQCVTAYIMPGPYSSQATQADAKRCAQALGITWKEQAITPWYKAMIDTLPEVGTEATTSLALQNLQARLRGLVLMTHANEQGALVMSTGNKSEYAMGYCTLYGDLCGAYAPLQDVLKTQVYALAATINRLHPGSIPASIIERAPSAELAPDQKDEDSLPPYPVLDAILSDLLEHPSSLAKLIDQHASPTWCQIIWHRLQQSEFKRRQAPVGPKISDSHLVLDRRVPITWTDETSPTG